MALKIQDIIGGGLFLGLLYIAWDNRDRIIEMLKSLGLPAPTLGPPSAPDDSVAPEDIPTTTPTPVTGYTAGSQIWKASWPSKKITQGSRTSSMCLDQSGSSLVRNSDGTATICGSSPRLTARGNFRDIEHTIFVNNEGAGEVNLTLRTEEYCGKGSSKTFSGYHTEFRLDRGTADIRKEVTHGDYRGRQNEKRVTFPRGWIGLRGAIFNVKGGGGVKIESYMSTNNGSTWKKVTEFLDNGKNGSQPQGSPYTNSASQSSIRFNLESVHVQKQIKCMKIRDFVIKGVTPR